MAVGVRAGDASSLGLAAAPGSGLSTSERKLPMRMATATSVLTATASTPTSGPPTPACWPIRGSRLEGSLGVEPLAGSQPGAGRRGSSLVTVDQLEPSQ